MLAAFLPPETLQLDGIVLSFSVHDNTVVTEGALSPVFHPLKIIAFRSFFRKHRKKQITSR